MRGGEFADLLHGALRALAELHRILRSAEPEQLPEVCPPGQREAAVAAAGAGAADVRLHHGDVRARGDPLDLKRGPESGETAADDADVGLLVALELLVLVWL